jgi:ATP adenylyltransferase
MERLWAPWRMEYIKAADEDGGCVFCLAASGDDAERLVVHRGSHAIVLLNKFPYSSGHFMVAPVRHIGDLGRIAGAGVVDHVHLHVVPRWAGDTNFMPVLADVKVLPEALEETRRKLRDAWPAA